MSTGPLIVAPMPSSQPIPSARDTADGQSACLPRCPPPVSQLTPGVTEAGSESSKGGLIGRRVAGRGVQALRGIARTYRFAGVALSTADTGIALVEGHEATLMLDCERQQVGVGHLAGAVEAGAVDHACVQQRDVAAPEDVVWFGARLLQEVDRLRRRDRARVAGLGEDAYEAVLRDRTRRPSRADLGVDPRRARSCSM